MITNIAFAAQRRALRVSQGRIARHAGISQPLLSQYELGNLALRPEQIAKLEEALRKEIAVTTENARRVAQKIGPM